MGRYPLARDHRNHATVPGCVAGPFRVLTWKIAGAARRGR
ncbi:hypothetical protein HD593_009995 [Nonomuraea rubra]|uniref:Uncharacterized protein n=1 Tax=Nonomuraea rubra TaxID=46180 RepID=A0A7X0P4N8_9ACTN|nr:hypothetical protein [Nonomuraea rubra]